jgi:hypothetical protein
MAVAGTAAAAGSAVAAGADLVDLTGAAPTEIAAFRRAHPGVPVCADGSDVDLTRDPSVAATSGARLICASREEAARSGLLPERLLIETSPDGLMTALAAGYPVLVDLPDGPAAHIQPGVTPPGTSPAGTPQPATAPPQANPQPTTPPPGAESPHITPLTIAPLGAHASLTTRADAGVPEEDPRGAGVPGEEPPGAGVLAVAALSGWLGAAVVRTRYPQPVRRALDLTDSVRGVRPPARTVRGLA